MFAIAAVLLNFDAAFACGTKAKAYEAAMKSDLRNLVSAQEAFFSDSARYTTNLASLFVKKSTGVASVTVTQVTDSGWAATATHSQTTAVCAIYVGLRPSDVDPGRAQGTPWCEGGKRDWTLAGQDVGISVLFFLAVLTLATFVFLRGPRGFGCAATGLTTLTALFALLVVFNSGCGLYPIALLAFFVVPALGVFALALWRHNRVSAAPP